ncbi:MAG: DUF2513 domain-containing protein [Kiritimatiellaeota bacterium]|nr:DUF2513 domain-containing protein [Kiritimatiellota bacterium]
MKRDMDLIRALLLKAEAELPGNWTENWGDHSADEACYHLALLIEAGLLDGNVTETEYQQIPFVMMNRLTWEGHDFLDRAKNENIWNKAKTKIKEVGGSVSIELMKKVLDSVITQQLGMT